MDINKALRTYWFLLIPVVTISIPVYKQYIGPDSSRYRFEKSLIRAWGSPEENREKLEILETMENPGSKDLQEIETLLKSIEIVESGIERFRKNELLQLIKIAVMLLMIGGVFISFFVGSFRSNRQAREDESPINVNNYAADPLAEKTSWTPLRGGGSNFATNTLKEYPGGDIVLKRSGIFKIFATSFIFIALVWGIGLEIFGAYYLGELQSIGEILPFLRTLDLTTVLVFTLTGLGILLFIGQSTTFSAARQTVKTRGRKIPFNSIKAIQILAELVVSKDSGSFHSYEMNLVFEDGSRENIMDHGDINRIIRDSRRIADLIGIPLWVEGHKK